MLKRKNGETGGSQRGILDSALNVLSSALAGRPAAEVIASGLSPTVNHRIKEATIDKDGKINTAINLTAHALWGAVEAYAGHRNIVAGAAGAATGEAAAKIIAETLYNKSPDKLSQEEKLTVSSLSQVAAGIVGGTTANSSDGAMIAAKTAKDAVENNFLSTHSQDRRDALEKKIKEGKASQKEIMEFISYETDDHTSDYLADKARNHPEKMTDDGWRRLGSYFQRYVSESLRNREKPGEINRSVKDIVLGNYIKGYGYAYALDAQYRSDLPSRWSLIGVDKSEQEEFYSDLKYKYITRPQIIRDSFNFKVAESTKDSLEILSVVYSGLGALKGLQAVNHVMSNSTKFTLGIAGAGSVAGQWSTNGYVDSRTLAIDLVTAYALKDKGFILTVFGNAASGALNGYVINGAVSQGAIGSGIGAAVGYGLGKVVEIPLDKRINPALTWSKYNPQSISNKAPYIESYRRNIVPNILGVAVGESGNRLYQIHFSSSQENN